ncbi:MAG: 2Fe-2S iron-sulfur cluster-binding protein [Pseudoruegeria sp.]
MKITFKMQDNDTKTVDALPGQSLMEVAIANDVSDVIAECGGGAICGTCHVKICEKWLDLVGPAEDFEEDVLDSIANVTATSRLSCQVLLGTDFDGLEVTVPKA